MADSSSKNNAVLVIVKHKSGTREDLTVPLNISAWDLAFALNEIYHLGMDPNDMSTCFLSAENPPALLKGSKKLKNYLLRDGSEIHLQNV